MGNKVAFTKFHVRAIVFLIAVVALLVGLLCGMVPDCVPAVDTSELPKSVSHQEGSLLFERNKRETNPWDDVRLPPDIRPTYYTMVFEPDLTGSDTFKGWVDIDVEVSKPTEYPRVHAKNLQFTLAKILDSNNEEVTQTNEPFYFEYNEFYVMDVGGPLDVGSYKFKFEYTGELGGKISGFYKSTYMVPGEVEPRYLATTDFEPTSAREAFPSFDEPNMKSYFKISLRHEKKYIGLSNMPEVSITDDDGMTLTEFGEPEVKMSTYLVCFIVCDFDFVKGKTARDIPFRVFAPAHQIHQANYALEVGINVTDFFEEYFGIPYSLSKLDMIAIPDFSAGAMENWGLITYRERYLLYDEKESSAGNKQTVCVVVAHELAHQWFGNIVTMDWWDDLWLNEGFASYMEYVGANHAEPSWQMMDQFVETLYSVFSVDQIVSSHPIIVDVNRPEEIIEVFDSIPYSKGASVLRMLNDFIGEASFKEGLTSYLNKFEYGNAKSADLWDSLQEAYDNNVGGGVNIAEIMDTWTKQMGFPVVNVERSGNDLRLTQDWFLVDPNANTSAAPYESPYDYNWEIPFTSKFQNSLEDDRIFTWMGVDGSEVSVPGDDSDWYIANFEQMGYYRVKYEENNWKALTTQLINDHEAIPVTDRSGLLEDSFNLANAEQLSYDIALDLTLYLDQENDYVPWDAAYGNFWWLNEILRFQPAYGDWRTYLAKQTANLMATYADWNETLSHLDGFLRSDIIYLACGSGNPDCLAEAKRQLQIYLNNGYVSPNVRSPVLRFGMEQDGGQENWDKMWEMYMNSTLSSEKSRLLSGMARTRHVWLLSRYIEYAMDESKIRSQDFFSVMYYIASNPVGNPLVWDFTRANWETLVDRFGINSGGLGGLIPDITYYYCTELKMQQSLVLEGQRRCFDSFTPDSTPSHIIDNRSLFVIPISSGVKEGFSLGAKMEEFFTKYPEAGAGTRGRQQALERVKTNIDWVKRNQDVIQQWLNRNL